MSTLSDLKSRIYTEIHKTLSAEVQNAVLDAVKFYQDKRFWFNEAQVNFNFSLTTMYSLNSVIPDMIAIDTLKVWSSGSPNKMCSQSWNALEEIDYGTATTNTPTDYAIHHEMLRIYPKPSVTLSAEASYHKAITQSASNSSSTAWTNEAEDLIRYRAKAVLYATVLLDAQQAQVEQMLEQQALNRLFTRTAKRSSGKIKRFL